MGPNNFVAQLRYLPRRMLTRDLLAVANFVFLLCTIKYVQVVFINVQYITAM